MSKCISFQQSSETPVNGASCAERPAVSTSLYDEQDLSSFQKLLDRELQLGAGRSLPPRRQQPAVDGASSQQTLQPSKSNVLLKLFKKFSSVVRSASKSSAAASSSKTSPAASRERDVPQNAGLAPKTIVHEHHHHHHVYHIHNAPGGADHHLYNKLHIQAVYPTRRHSSDSHTCFDVPVEPAAHRTAHAAFRRRFSSEVPRPFKLMRADEQFKSVARIADHHASK